MQDEPSLGYPKDKTTREKNSSVFFCPDIRNYIIPRDEDCGVKYALRRQRHFQIIIKPAWQMHDEGALKSAA